MIHKVLVPLDGSARAKAALPHAVAIAQAFDAELHLLRVVDLVPNTELGVVDSLAWRMAQVGAGAYLDGIASELSSQGQAARTEVLEGRAADEIVGYIHSSHIDMVVLTTHGEGAATGFDLGGTARKVVDGAGVSVTLVPSLEPPESRVATAEYHRILAPVDCSGRSEWAVSLAAILAHSRQAELVLVHVVPLPLLPPGDAGGGDDGLAEDLMEASRAFAADYLSRLCRRLKTPSLMLRSRLVVAPAVGEALTSVLAEEDPDLTVLCAHGAAGHTGRPFGSVAARFLGSGQGVVVVLQDLAPASGSPITAHPAHTATAPSGH